MAIATMATLEPITSCLDDAPPPVPLKVGLGPDEEVDVGTIDEVEVTIVPLKR